MDPHRFARAVAAVPTGLLYAVGFVIGLVWLLVVWCVMSLRVGFADARYRWTPDPLEASEEE